jgi:uncharacterized membrane-anchored protein YhcB (DUF1043 family)
MDDRNNPTLTTMLWWLLSGIVLVSAAFIIRSGSGLWSAIDSAGLVAGVYIVAMTLYVARKPLRWQARLWVYAVVCLSVGVIAFSWYQNETSTRLQEDLRRRQYAVQARGAAVGTMTSRFHRVLEEYYQRGARSKETLSEVFFRQNQSLKDGKKELLNFMERWNLSVESQAADSIVVVAHSAVKGDSADFRNIDGTTGAMQERVILTKKGIVHVSEN